jgi:hypothetical protein
MLASSNDPAVGTQHLPVDPGPVETGEESDDSRDIRRLAWWDHRPTGKNRS